MGSGKEPSFLKLMDWDAWEVGGLKLKKKKKNCSFYLPRLLGIQPHQNKLIGRPPAPFTE